MTYHIIEVANTHAGSIDYLYDLIREFESFKPNFGIKFQPFKFDCIATEDYKDYELYKNLFFSSKTWSEIINFSCRTKEIWLDIFDSYSFDVFIENRLYIKGIKLQASIINNKTLIDKMCEVGIKDKKLIINLSGFSLDQIKEVVGRLEKKLMPEELILQFGYQSYPTLVEDSNLSKLKIIKSLFPEYRISFADHSPGDLDDAIFLPILAIGFGASVIEKHVMRSGLVAKYDYFSSMTFDAYKYFVDKCLQYEFSVFCDDFIVEKEKKYLDSSNQKPLLVKNKKQGDSIWHSDLIYKRSSKPGIDIFKLNNLLTSGHILQCDKLKGDALLAEDFKRSIVATVIACRMKSSRLPGKALLKFGGLTSIEQCIKSALQFTNVNYTILATSTENEDAVLGNYTYSESVIFHRGHPIDVVDRYLDISEKLGIDVIIRVTGDMPFVSEEIKNILLNSHFMTGADYTSAKEAAIGTNLEIINVNALRKIKKNFPFAEHSEYMTFYFKNNQEFFNLNIVSLPEEYIRNYRLTLDYSEDLEMFDFICKYMIENEMELNIKNIFNFLDLNPNVAAMNQSCITPYKSNEDLISILNKNTKIVKLHD